MGLNNGGCVTRILAGAFCAAVLAAQTPPALRLGGDVRPVRFRLDLKVIPAAEDFSGVVDAEVELRQPASLIWLNGTDLKVTRATLEAGGRTFEARVLPGGEDFIGFQFDQPVPAGSAEFHVAYTGRVNSRISQGLFRNQDAGNWYAYTQFEAIDARRAFPCFDEPSFKIPWQLTLHVPAADAAFANSPAVSETPESGGLKAVRFAETRPLPSYLVAFAVGPFETVDAGKAGRKSTPLRIVVPRGRAGEAPYAASVTGQLLTTLEDYFDIPYPYDKLDSIAVPLFPGAMENPGLITYGDTILLARPSQDSISRQREYSSIAAHEMAHLWFGDLVTTAWWNDIWLNEAFATWMASKVLEQWKPDWEENLSAAGERLVAMRADSLVSARAIRQPIESKSDIANAFDTITYEKGAAVIYMFEHWLTPAVFRKGVQAFLKQHADGNATASDFLAAQNAAADRNVATAFSTFLDQPGVPLVSAALDCRQGPPKIALNQKRYLPLGSPPPNPPTWRTPVCLRYSDSTGVHSQCEVLNGAEGAIPLPAASGCPAWVVLNSDESGYYRTLYRGDLFRQILANAATLTPAERMGLAGDVEAVVRGGEMAAGEALGVVSQFAGDSHRQVVQSTIDIVVGISAHMVPDALRPNYQRFIGKTFGAQARALGWQAGRKESEDTSLLRPDLVSLVANEGEDQQLVARALDLARRWLDDRKAIQPELVETVLPTAARHGDRKLYERFRAELLSSQDPSDRREILNAIASFADPALVKENFALFLSGKLDPRESMPLLLRPLDNWKTGPLSYEFVRANYDRIATEFPSFANLDFAAYLPRTAAVFCDSGHYADAESFFTPRVEKVMGASRILAQSLERIRQCSAQRAAVGPGVAAFLEKQ
jgi:cytosol alanyl aminopeptidase